MSNFADWVESNKALWTRVYDEVIAPKLEEEWKQREEALRIHWDQGEAERHAPRRDLENQDQQNSRLREESLNSHHDSDPIDRNTSTSNDLSTLASEHQQLSTEYAELSRKYEDLAQKVKYLEQKNNAVMRKNKDMKESVRAWQKYADRQSVKQKLKDDQRDDDRQSEALIRIEDGITRLQRPSTPNLRQLARSPLTMATPERSSPAPFPPLASSRAGSVNRPISARSDASEQARSLRSSITPRALQSHLPSDTQANETGNLPHLQPLPEASVSVRDNRKIRDPEGVIVGSSQTTQDENAESSSKENRDDGIDSNDDTPEIVSERSLKRKRHQDSASTVHTGRSSDGTTTKPHNVKEEQQSSPPLSTYKLIRNETIDLDVPAPNVLRTPRQSERTRLVRPDSIHALCHERSSSFPSSNEVKRENDTLLMDNDGQENIAKVSNMAIGTAAPDRATSEPFKATKTPNALASLNPNIPAHVDELVGKRRKQSGVNSASDRNTRLKTAESTRSTRTRPKRFTPTTARARYHERIEMSKSPAKTAVQATSANRSRVGHVKVEGEPLSLIDVQDPPDTPSNKASSTPMTARRPPAAIPPVDHLPAWTMNTPMTRASARKFVSTRTHQETCLRLKGLCELQLQDFKPNPAYNHGYSHAFSETVRKRGERLCLPGCTNPECCGSTFRVLAEAQAPLSYAEEEELLEAYLGDAYDNMRLTQMAAEERKELILQARTRKIAMEAGKHREMYERRRTPPGFWRVDFPSTQERMEDRERAMQQEKAMVKERWMEAQRRGGRWLFRDE